MPGQRGSERRRMEEQVLVRLSAGMAAIVQRGAKDTGLSKATWVRMQLAEQLGGDPEDVVPVRAQRAPRPPAAAHVVELAGLREVVAELAGALVQATIRSREGGRLDTHAAIEQVIPGVRKAVRDLDGLKRAMLADRADR